MLPIQTILHPTDFSGSSDAAFRLACSLAKTHGAKIHVLHVGRHPVIVPVKETVPLEPEQYREALSTKLLEMRADDPNILVEHQLLFVGNPAEEILRVAQAIKADLIVMGTHGRTGLSWLLMGSVAEQVLRKAPCPVVTVRTPLPKAAPPEEAAVETAGSAGGV